MWTIFKDWIFYIIQFFYDFAGDWGLAIIIVTLILRLILWPLVQKQTKSTYDMQKLQPLMEELKEKYANDPQKYNEEVQRVYSEVHFNPLAGCLPMLVQLPIFMALFQVLREMGARDEVANYCFYNIVPNLVKTPADMWQIGLTQFLPYLILMIVFGVVTFLPMIIQQMNNNNEEQKRQMFMMSGFMSLFMLWIGWSSPAGVLLYWGTSSIFGVLQQYFTQKSLGKKDAEKEAQIEALRPVNVKVVRKEKKARPKKKS